MLLPQELIAKFAPFIHPNVWPKDDLQDMEPNFKALGELVVDVGRLVGRQCDLYGMTPQGHLCCFG